MITLEQRELCARFGAKPSGLGQRDTAGVADSVAQGLLPINGLRHPRVGDSSGWFLWGGEQGSIADDFFKPIHVHHLEELSPEVLRYLALPPGWRFLIADGYEDVWFDESLLHV